MCHSQKRKSWCKNFVYFLVIYNLFLKYKVVLRTFSNCMLQHFVLYCRLNESNWSGFQTSDTNSNSVGSLQWASSYGTSSINGGVGGNNSRVVVIHRDDRGFGFVVAGDNPVFVQTVREGNKQVRLKIKSFAVTCLCEWKLWKRGGISDAQHTPSEPRKANLHETIACAEAWQISFCSFSTRARLLFILFYFCVAHLSDYFLSWFLLFPYSLVIFHFQAERQSEPAFLRMILLSRYFLFCAFCLTFLFLFFCRFGTSLALMVVILFCRVSNPFRFHLQVNGSWVTQSNHAEVVDLIRGTHTLPLFCGTTRKWNSHPVMPSGLFPTPFVLMDLSLFSTL